MDRHEIFARLFGHCAHQAIQIETAVAELLEGAEQYTREHRAAAAVALMPFPTFAATLKAVPACGELSRRHAEQPPAGSLRFAPAEYETLSDAQQEAITAVVFQALVRWRAFLQAVPDHLAGLSEAKLAAAAYGNGAAAFEVLAGFDALMCNADMVRSMVKVDSFVSLCTAQVLASLDEVDGRPARHDARAQFIATAGPGLSSLAEAAWSYQQLAESGQRFVVLDLAAGLDSIARNPMGETLKSWAGALATSSFPDRHRLLHRAVIAAAAELHQWRPPEIETRMVSLTAPADPTWRRCTRVLAMVHELHKAGYQRLRVLPFVSGSGCYWRGWITSADNVLPDGYSLADDDMAERCVVAKYTSGQENEFFGWPDAKAMSARELAATFLERFPKIAARGRGCDWAYVGWLTDVLGFAELGPDGGGLVSLVNHDGPMSPAYLARWQPPPPCAS